MTADTTPSDTRPAGRTSHRLLLELGRGGMGVVFLAERLQSGSHPTLVVVKKLLPALSSNVEIRQMFLDEGRLTMRLRHPRLARTLDAGFDGQTYWFEMEYLEGLALNTVLRTGIPLRIGLFVLLSVLEGLHAAHELEDEQGVPLSVVHRDVSPHNVFITYDGDVKVLDFGIAKAADSSTRTRTGAVKGKLTYMAPEQILRRDVDRRADIFAVGVILWEVLHGQRFWGDLPDEEIYVRLKSGELSPVSAVRADVPASLANVCQRAVQLSREDRFATAIEMRSALADAASETGVADAQELAAHLLSSWSAEREGMRAQLANARNQSARFDRDLGLSTRGLSATYDERREPPSRRSWARPLVIGGALAVAAASAMLFRSASAFRTPASSSAPSASSPSPAVPPACETNVQCSSAHGGEAWMCRGAPAKCVALASEDCHLLGDRAAVDRDDTLWVGAMFPLTGPDAPKFGEASLSAVDLARRDFAEVSHGLPPAREGGAPRPLGIIACDDDVNAERAARHLVDDLAVPAVIGFHSSDEVLSLAQTVFFPHRTMMVAALNTSDLLTTIPTPRDSPRLLWRTAISTNRVTPALAAIVGSLLEPRLRQSGGPLHAQDAMRVAVLRPNTTTGRSAVDALVADLRFNGKSVIENGASFRDIAFATPDGAGTSLPVAVREVIAHEPHAIVMFADQMTDELIRPIEAAWPASAKARPYYILGGAFEGDDLFRFLGKDPERRKRFIGVGPVYGTPANARFTMHYNETFTPKVTMATSPAAPYDSMYLLAYAAAASGNEPLTGATLAHSVVRLLPPGNPVDVGPSGIFGTLTTLGAGSNVDLHGAYTPLDFNPTTGETDADFSVLCLGVDKAGNATDSVESGLVFEGRERMFRGKYGCQ